MQDAGPSGRTGHRAARRALGAALAAVVLAGALGGPPAARGAEPPEASARRYLAETLGASPNDFELVYERPGVVVGGTSLWGAKFVDARTGEVHVVYADHGNAGAVGGIGVMSARQEAAKARLAPLAKKGDLELQGAVSAAAPGEKVPVGIWLDADSSAAEAAVIAAHPELTWDGDRPIVEDLDTARRIRAELEAAAAAVNAEAVERLRTEIAALGGTVAYASTGAPLVYVDVPADRVDDLAEVPAVDSLGLERTWASSMSSAGPAVQANWTSGAGDQGNGVRVAVVEYHNVRNAGDLAGRVVASRSTTGRLAYTSGGLDHPTWVAGAIGGRTGVAPGSLIVSSSTGGGSAGVTRDRQIIAAADWAASASGGDADVINASIGQDTATGSEEARRYFDYIVDRGGRLAVAASGNFTTFGHWDIVSPGTAYNVLTVGGLDDRNTAGRSDDRIWYYPGSNGSNYRDRTDVSWNPNGDYNKPNVSAPAASVVTANGLGASGTSVASPIVAGIAAQLIARLPALALRPEATRALIMAGAIQRSPLPTGGLNADHEGTGSASALWSNRLLTSGDSRYGGHRMGTVFAGQPIVQEIAVTAGQKVKVALAWNSDSDRTVDRLRIDLDLRVVQPNGTASGSFTFDNSYEWVEFVAASTGTARIEIRQARFDAASDRYGLAWAKWNVGTPSRIAGSDRYATAAAVSRAHFAAGAPVAYVATGTDFPDALAVGPVAGIQGGPVLLTARDALPQATRDELARLRPQRIVVVGGTSAVSAGVQQQLQAYTSQPVGRIAGADRYATASAVSGASFGTSVPAAFVATGFTFPDALVAGPAAVVTRAPILLSRPDRLPDATRAELERLRPARIYVVGGASAVGDAVVEQLRGLTAGPVERLAGSDRYATAAAVSARFFSTPPLTYLATGANFPDALATVPAAGRAASPMLLAQRTGLPTPTRNELLRLWPPRTRLIGSTGVLGDEVARQITALLGRP